MNTYHAKSPCCGAWGRRFGKRRRQCAVCIRTWRIRKKQRGRKPRRAHTGLVLRYLRHELPSLYARARNSRVSGDTLKRTLRASRDVFLARTPWPTLPTRPPLIAVADAMIQRLEGTWYTFYFILIRRAGERAAFVAPLSVRSGAEGYEGWRAAFARLSPRTLAAIRALVCDGRVGLVAYARQRAWHVQRCHVHLLARLHKFRTWHRASPYYEEGQRLSALVHSLLVDPHETAVAEALPLLNAAAHATRSRAVRSILSGFARNYPDYRTYLMHPELVLPRTSNAVESVIASVRALLYRARGFRTLRSLTQWIETFLKSKKHVACNGYYQPN